MADNRGNSMKSNIQEPAPFNIVDETLNSIRKWIDKITELSLGLIGGERIPDDEMIVIKHRMVKGLISLTSPLIIKEEERKEINNFFKLIKFGIGSKKDTSGVFRNVPVYTAEVNYLLDDCVVGIQKALNKYFKPGSEGRIPY